MPAPASEGDSELLRDLTEASDLVVYEYDATTSTLQWRGPLDRLLGHALESAQPAPLPWVCEQLHPDDRDRFCAQLQRALDEDLPISQLLRLQSGSGRFRTFHQRGARRPHRPTRVVGTLLDVSESDLQEHTLRQLLEHTAAAAGTDFFDRLVEQAGLLLQARRVLVARRGDGPEPEMEVVAAWQEHGESQRPTFHGGPGSATHEVLRSGALAVPDDLARRYPLHAERYERLGITGYAGVALTVGHGEPLGVLAVMYGDHQPPHPQALPVLRLFSSRAAAELERMQHIAAVERLNLALEQRVAERTAQLQAANTELEAFSYSVSHDLRAPLRAIAGFSRALEEDYGPRLDGTGQDYLRRIQSGSKRMGALIDDLLTLARISRGELRHQPVDLTALAHQIAAEAGAQSGRRPPLVVGPNLTARGDPELLRVMLGNLLDNAWKYTRHCPEPHVEFDRLPSPDEHGATVFVVRDNGAGFDMRYAGKLFGAFQRLHPATEFEGTGVGLATVRRIVHRHGGRVWADATPGGGARFYFTLKANAS